jgi:hypothetical protein
VMRALPLLGTLFNSFTVLGARLSDSSEHGKRQHSTDAEGNQGYLSTWHVIQT